MTYRHVRPRAAAFLLFAAPVAAQSAATHPSPETIHFGQGAAGQVGMAFGETGFGI